MSEGRAATPDRSGPDAHAEPAAADDGSTEPAALAKAVRAAARFDRNAASIGGGLLAAIPVTALLGGGLAVGQPVAAVTMAAGAMLVGTAWRTSGGRPPLALMATDAVLMSVSTFVGCVTGAHLWVHVPLLCLWSLLAGMLVSLGQRGSVLGTQAIIAVVVFGRFSEPAGQALGLAAYVLSGGLAQVVFLRVVRWPPPVRAQRRLTAAAYRALAEFATAPADAAALPAGEALDEAESALASGALFADPTLLTLRSLVAEGHRMRVQLTAIHALQRRDGFHRIELTPTLRHAAGALLELTGVALEYAARAIEGDESAGAALEQTVGTISAQSAAMRDATDPSLRPVSVGTDPEEPPPGSAILQMARRFSALAGQFRAMASLAPTAGEASDLRRRRPTRRTNQPLERLRADLALIQANATLDSPAGRHALRLAVVVPVATLIARGLPLSRDYWMVVAAATVLRPEFGSTFTRGTERALGTSLGVALAGAIASSLHPTGTATVVIVGILAWAGYALFPASFAIGFAFITAVVVFLLNAISPDTIATATARLLDTFAGGTIGLIAYALWPTWSRTSARHQLAAVVAAQRDYISTVLGAVVSGRAPDDEMRARARASRRARTQAEAAVAQSLADPATRQIDGGWSQGVLAAMRRLIQGAHVLRLEVQDTGTGRPLPALEPLADDLDAMLTMVGERLEHDGEALRGEVTPDLRARFASFERACRGRPGAPDLLTDVDEVVDAANGLAALVGFDPGDAGDPSDAGDPGEPGAPAE